jgi:hypothetical protein
MKFFGSIERLVSILFRKNGQDITVRPNQATTYTAARDIQLPAGDTDHELVSKTATQTLTNKTIDGDDNTIQDLALSSIKTVLADADKVIVRDVAGAVVSAKIVNANIDAAAGIAATKIADGSVSNTEFQYLDGVTSAIQTQLNAKIPSTEKGAASGVCPLNSSSKIDATYLPSSLMDFKGAWNATTNSPTLADGTGDNGDVYRVSTAGTQDLGSGSITFFVGDWVIYNGTIWQRSPAADFSGFANTALSNLAVTNMAAGDLLVASSASAVARLAIGTNGYFLKSNGTTATWDALPGESVFQADWATGDGATKSISHSLGSRDVRVEIYDKGTYETLMVGSVVRTDANTVDLTSSEAPGASGWRVLIRKN